MGVSTSDDETDGIVTEMIAPANGRFQTTRWSVVLRTRGERPEVAAAAWNELAHAYWYPLYAACRREGLSAHDAQDLTQSFFAHLLDGDRLAALTPEKGRFRSYLLRALRNFISNHARDARAQIRGGGTHRLPIEVAEGDPRFRRSIETNESFELAFDRDWAETLLGRVKERLAEHYVSAGKSEIFAEIRGLLTPRENTESYGQIGTRFGLSAAAVSMLVTRMRLRFRKLLLDEIAATVENPEDVDDELKNLMAVLRTPRG